MTPAYVHQQHQQRSKFDKSISYIPTHNFIIVQYVEIQCIQFFSAKLGANAILGVSLAVCKAGAAQKVTHTHTHPPPPHTHT